MVILGVPELHNHVLDCLGSSCPGPLVIERTTLAKLTRTHLLLFSSIGGSCLSADISPNQCAWVDHGDEGFPMEV